MLAHRRLYSISPVGGITFTVSSPQSFDQTHQFHEVCCTEPTFSRSQDSNGIFRSQIGPAQWNLTLAAFLGEEADSLFTAIFFACQNFKLMARERMKGMRDLKS